ncbi:MAG: hypothetical protein JWL81_1660 [Verrucomicrobiales bacterium]|nr:hypothetical protein [Verrucomicrobiales bacterium]
MFAAPFTAMIVLSLGTVGTVSCRQYSTVERHFLRVPAQAAADLSSIDRAKWLKQSRKQPAFKESAATRQTMVMAAETRPARLNAPEGEVKFFAFSASDPNARDGAVALNWAEAGGRLEPREGARTRLHLLRTQGGRYVTESPDRFLPKGLEVDRHAFAEEPGVIFCYRRTGPGIAAEWKKVAVLKWNGRGWTGAAVEESRH